MKARKCDRCKGYFDINSERSEVKMIPWNERPLDWIDLCPDCTVQLLSWFKNEADVIEAKHGRWLDGDGHQITGICSVCGFESHLYENDVAGMNYCPNCGVDMQGRIE